MRAASPPQNELTGVEGPQHFAAPLAQLSPGEQLGVVTANDYGRRQ